MARSLSEQLDAIDSLIAALEERKAQSYTLRGRTEIDKELKPLYAERRLLMGEVADSNSNSGSMASVCQVEGPR